MTLTGGLGGNQSNSICILYVGIEINSDNLFAPKKMTAKQITKLKINGFRVI